MKPAGENRGVKEMAGLPVRNESAAGNWLGGGQRPFGGK